MNAHRTVRAARLKEHGKPLHVKEVELREPGPDEVLVELRYGGVNPIDRYIAEGWVAGDRMLPRTLGVEASGTLDGRPVLVAGEGLGALRDGVWAEAAVVPRAAVVELPRGARVPGGDDAPDGVDLRDAAAMGIAGLTAWEVVRELGRVTPEDRVLVLGASGGVGTMIVSLAQSIGATVWGQTASPEKTDVIERQGADRVIVTDPDDLVRIADDPARIADDPARAIGDLARIIGELEPTIVFDPLGGGFLAASIEALAIHGRIVSFGASAAADARFNLPKFYRKGLSLLGYAGGQLGRERRRAGLAQALEALRDGSLRVHLDEVLALGQVNEAFERLADRKVAGKLILDLRR
jgi:NADPH2:quinone reductase